MLDKMLKELEPEIKNKCVEIRERKREKRMQILFEIVASLLLFVPSLFIILNISLTYMFIGIIIIISLILFVNLPRILKDNIDLEKGKICYE